MDPNYVHQLIQQQLDAYHDEADWFDVSTLVEAVSALDDWILSGGFIPEVWAEAGA